MLPIQLLASIISTLIELSVLGSLLKTITSKCHKFECFSKKQKREIEFELQVGENVDYPVLSIDFHLTPMSSALEKSTKVLFEQ